MFSRVIEDTCLGLSLSRAALNGYQINIFCGNALERSVYLYGKVKSDIGFAMKGLKM